VVHHILRNSMLPVVTLLGMDIALALGSTVFIEEVFNLHGLGNELIAAIHGDDIPLAVGITVCITLVAVVVNLIVDVAYTWLDPRIWLADS
jgi:peptide/nickel transport system permease protein